MRTKSELRPYQVDMVQRIKNTKKCALFLDMGLGKSIITLNAINDLLNDGLVKNVLIIAPLRVANLVWKQECEVWSNLNHLIPHIGICTGKLSNRLNVLKQKPKILIVNRDITKWITQKSKVRFDFIVIDESSSFKSAKSKRFRALRVHAQNSTYLTLLTGTPSPNSLLDLWSQVYLIDSGQRLGRTIYEYKNRYFYPTGYNGYTFKPKEFAQKIIQEKISDICFTLRASDYIDLPDKIINNQYVYMDMIGSFYDEMEKEFAVMLQDTYIIANSKATQINKLLQLCNGFMYDVNNQAQLLDDSKIKALLDMLEDYPNENFIITYNFRNDKALLLSSIPTAVALIDNDDNIRLWNDGKIQYLLLHPASSGHGLNLQFGGNNIIWYGLTWNLENYLQTNARLHRSGQTKPVTITHLICKDTVEEKVLKALINKENVQESILNALKLKY